MLKRKRSNKGFTLIELIIAISIFSIVVFMGYMIINGSNKASINQKKVSNEQQSANLINMYLTKDLQNTNIEDNEKNIELSNNAIEENGDLKTDCKKYEYKITNSNNDEITYTIEINDNKTKYSVVRSDEGGTKIEIISNEKYVSNKAPLYINLREDKNIYDIKMFYKDNEYGFSINPRIEIVKLDSGESNGGDNGVSINGDGIRLQYHQHGLYKHKTTLDALDGKIWETKSIVFNYNGPNEIAQAKIKFYDGYALVNIIPNSNSQSIKTKDFKVISEKIQNGFILKKSIMTVVETVPGKTTTFKYNYKTEKEVTEILIENIKVNNGHPYVSVTW